jgi:hypothetical protein
MPISHPLQTIFVHIPKTAGTAVEAVLGMHGDKPDIGIVPYFNQHADKEHLYGRDLQHMTAARIREVLGDDALFARYFKFAVVRNPWDRLVSTCAWTNQKWAKGEALEPTEFDAIVRELYSRFQAAKAASQPLQVSPHFNPQAAFVLGQDLRPMVDFIARYETLSQDWQHIRARLGVTADLPNRMKSHHLPYREYYRDDTRAMVAEIYDQDARLFGYGF